MRLRPNLQQRLANVRSDLTDLRAELAVLDEQLAYAEAVAAEAQTQAVVEGSPVTDLEYARAQGDTRRVRRERDEALTRLDALAAEQDALLEELFARVQQGSSA